MLAFLAAPLMFSAHFFFVPVFPNWLRPALMAIVAAWVAFQIPQAHAAQSSNSREAFIIKSSMALATEDEEHSHYEQRPEVLAFIDEMTEKYGFFRAELVTLFSYARYNPTVARLMTPATSTHPQSWREYRKRFIEPIRINAGENHAILFKLIAISVIELIAVAVPFTDCLFPIRASADRIRNKCTRICAKPH